MSDRMSWREIDRLRDRGGRRPRRDALERALEDPRLKAKYLQEAERLFMGPKGRPGHDKALQTLHDAYGTPAFAKRADDYCREYGFPDEWRTLILFLDLESRPDLQVKAMETLAGMAPGMAPQERRGFVGKLRLLAATAGDPDVQELAEELLEELT